MLTLIIITLLAALSFRKILNKRGYGHTYIWTYPFVTCTIICLASFFIEYVAGVALHKHESFFLETLPYLLDFVGIVFQFACLSMIWSQIRKLKHLTQ